jgi:hypothetical protein
MGVGPVPPDPDEEMLAMEFDWSPRPMAPMFSDEALVPGPGEDDETGAGSDFFVWDNILPESAGQAHNVTNPMSVIGPGIDTSLSLASRLQWRPVSANAHPQTWLSYRGRPVPIDNNIAPLVEAMWAAGFVTLACCEGNQTDTETGYVMFSEEIGKRFMEWAQVYEEHLPAALMRRFEILLQDDEWRPYMAARYPLLQRVEPDAEGRLFTLSWRFHRQDLLDHRDLLVKLLRAGARHRTELG